MNLHIFAKHFCPLCNGRVFSPFKLGLYKCEVCNLVISPLIWEEKANEMMEDIYFGKNYESRKSSVWVKAFEARNNRKTLSRLATFAKIGNRLLEIGVGSGSFLRFARVKGFDVMGCDLSWHICQHIESLYGIKMHCGPICSLPAKDLFDIVVMNHVLEHVQEPLQFLQDTFRLLRPGGIIHIAVPNINCWEAKLYGWTSYEPYHLVYFSSDTLMKTVVAAGFKIEHIVTSESFSGWFLAILRTMIGVNRNDGAIRRPSEEVKANTQNMRSGFAEHVYRSAMVLSGFLTWPLRRMQAYLGKGDELVCIARKSCDGDRDD